MAQTIYDALVNVDVQDNDAPGQLARIVQQLQREIASLGSTPEVNLGDKLLGSLGTGVLTAQEGVQRLRIVMAELGSEMARLGAVKPELQTGDTVKAIFQLERLRHETEAVASAFDRLSAAQGAHARIPQSAQERRLGKLPEEARLDALRSNIQPLPEPSRAENERLLQLTRQAEVDRMNARNRQREDVGFGYDRVMDDPRGYELLTERQKRKVSGTRPGEEFVGSESIMAAMEDEGASRKEIAAALREEARGVQRRIVDLREYPDTEMGNLVGERDDLNSTASVLSAEESLASVRKREAEAAQKEVDRQEAERAKVQNLSASIDQTASAKIQQAQYNAAVAKADLATLESAKTSEAAQSKIVQARIKVANTEAALEAVKQRELEQARRAAAPTGFLPSLFGTAGGRGGGGGGGFGIPGGGGGQGGGLLGGLANEAGFAAKYYALYRTFSLVEQTIVGVKTATEEYTLAVNNLSIAMGTSYNEASQVAEGYARIGQGMATSPTVAVEGATKFTRSFREDNGSIDPNAGAMGATVASLVNVLEGPTKLTNTVESLVAVSKAYDLGTAGAASAYDQATRIGQVYGVPTAGELLPGVAQIADLGKTSGFDMDQLLALVAASMQSTGLTGDAVAGDIKRFLGADTTGLDKTLGALGGDTSGNLASKLEQLSAILEKLPQERRDDIMRGLGGSRSAATVQPFIEALSQLDQTKATADGMKSATEQANDKLKTLGGAFQTLSADTQALFTALSQSGAGDLFAITVQGLHELLSGLTEMIRLFGQVNPALRGVASAILALLAASAAAARIRGVQNTALLGGLLPVTAGRAAAQASAASLPALASYGAGGAALSGSGAALAAGGAGIAGLGAKVASLGSAAGAAALAMAPMLAILGAIVTIGAASNAANKGTTGANAAAEGYGAGQKAIGEGNVAEIQAQAENQRQAAKDIMASGDGFGGKALYGITNSVLWLQGQTTLSDAQQKAAAAANKYADELDKAADAAAKEAALKEEQSRQYNFSALFGPDYSDVSGGISKVLQLGATPGREMDVLKDLVANGSGDSLQLNSLLAPAEGDKGIADLISDFQSRNSKLTDPNARNSGLAALQAQMLDLQRRALAAKADPAALDSINQLVDGANAAYNDSVVSLTEAKINSIKAIQGDTTKSRATITTLVTQALSQVAATGDVDQVAKMLAGVDQAFIDSFLRKANAQLTALRSQAESLRKAQAIAAQLAQAAYDDAIGGAGSVNAAESTGNIRDQKIADAKSKADAAARDAASKQKTIDTVKAATPLAAPDNKYFTFDKDKAKEEAEALEIARIQSQEIPGDPLSQASIALRVARFQLSHASKNTADYFQALKAVHEAQYSYAKVLQDQANTEAQLASDITDPVAQAQLKLAAARRQLSADQGRGALGDVIASDKLAVKQATSEAERAAFDQKFSDERTNYELQRTSLSAYLSYLRSQHDYLTSVKNKTRQQIDELNQVDQALKSLADGLQGQFNLGDIRIPAPYEVRRAMAGGGNYAATQSTSYVNITINGNDISSMKQVLQDYMGQPIVMSSATAAPKV